MCLIAFIQQVWLILTQHMSRVGQNRNIHRIWPYIWWFPCQKYRIYTVYIWFWPTLLLDNAKNRSRPKRVRHMVPRRRLALNKFVCLLDNAKNRSRPKRVRHMVLRRRLALNKFVCLLDNAKNRSRPERVRHMVPRSGRSYQCGRQCCNAWQVCVPHGHCPEMLCVEGDAYGA